MPTGTRMLRGTDIAAMLAFRAMNTIHPTAKDTETEFFSQFLSLASVPEFFNKLIRLARLPKLRSPCVTFECGEAAGTMVPSQYLNTSILCLEKSAANLRLQKL